jgi:hypothetical protein
MLRDLFIIVFGGALAALSLLVFYGWPRETTWGMKARSRVVYHQMRLGTVVGGSRIWPAMLPLGLAFVLVGISAAIDELGALPATLADIVMWAGVISLLIVAVMVVYPPKWLLPAWYVEEKRRIKSGLQPTIPPPPEGAIPTMTSRQRAASVAILAVGSAIYVYLGWPIQYLLIGLASGLTYLAFVRIR